MTSYQSKQLLTLEEHQLLAVQTMNPELTERERTANCGMGLACEALELSQALYPRAQGYGYVTMPWSSECGLEIVGELGDLCWYTAVLADSYGRLTKQPELWKMDLLAKDVDILEVIRLYDSLERRVSVERAFHQLCDHVEVAAGLVKWHLFHNHEFTDEVGEQIRNALRSVLECVRQIAMAGCQVSLGAVLYANIEKLKKRYPTGKFTTSDSINRSD